MEERISERIGMLLKVVDEGIAERRPKQVRAAAEAIECLCSSLASGRPPSRIRLRP